MDIGNVLLRNVGFDPDFRKIGYHEQLLGGLNHFSFGQISSDDSTGKWCVNGDIGTDDMIALELKNLLIGHPQQL